jgi:hypothetical protein
MAKASQAKNELLSRLPMSFVFFFQFFGLKTFANFSKFLAKIVKFTLFLNPFLCGLGAITLLSEALS